MSVCTSGVTYHLMNSHASFAFGEFLLMPIAAGKLQVLPTSGRSMYLTFGACFDVCGLFPTAVDPCQPWWNVPEPLQNRLCCGVAAEVSASGLINLSEKKLRSSFIASRAFEPLSAKTGLRSLSNMGSPIDKAIRYQDQSEAANAIGYWSMPLSLIVLASC